MTAWRMAGLGRRGAAAVEFALVAMYFVPFCLAVMEGGLLLWTQCALQSTAAFTARCAAISSPNCTNSQKYAVSTAANWLFPSVITTSNVTATAATCISHVSYMEINISCPFWGSTILPPPFNGLTLTATAYFPSSATAC